MKSLILLTLLVPGVVMGQRQNPKFIFLGDTIIKGYIDHQFHPCECYITNHGISFYETIGTPISIGSRIITDTIVNSKAVKPKNKQPKKTGTNINLYTKRSPFKIGSGFGITSRTIMPIKDSEYHRMDYDTLYGKIKIAIGKGEIEGDGIVVTVTQIDGSYPIYSKKDLDYLDSTNSWGYILSAGGEMHHAPRKFAYIFTDGKYKWVNEKFTFIPRKYADTTTKRPKQHL